MERGTLLRQFRERKGYSLRTLADFVNMSHVTVWRIERGYRSIHESEIRDFADALQISQHRLQTLYEDVNRENTPGSDLHRRGQEVSVTEILPFGDDYATLLEGMRMHGEALKALLHSDGAVQKIESLLLGATRREEAQLQRLYAKTWLIHMFAHTMIAYMGPGFQHQDVLEQASTVRRSLAAEDQYFSNMAALLPALHAYLTRDYIAAQRHFDLCLDTISDSYIRGVCLRDKLAMAGKLRDPRLYRSATARANESIDHGELTMVDEARVLEGKAQAELLMDPEQSLATVEKADKQYQASGLTRPSIRSQIERTRIQALLVQRLPDREYVRAMAQESFKVFRRGGFARHLSQVKRVLLLRSMFEPAEVNFEIGAS